MYARFEKMQILCFLLKILYGSGEMLVFVQKIIEKIIQRFVMCDDEQ